MLEIKVLLTSKPSVWVWGSRCQRMESTLSLEVESLLSSHSPPRTEGCLGWWVTFLTCRSLLVSDGTAGMSAGWE